MMNQSQVNATLHSDETQSALEDAPIPLAPAGDEMKPDYIEE